MRISIVLLSLVLGVATYSTSTASAAAAPLMKEVIALSRDATVQIVSAGGNLKGTGFLVGRKHVVTCFHLVARIAPKDGQTTWEILQDIKVKLSNGAKVGAKVVSIPSDQLPEPLLLDFAVLELDQEIPEKLFSAVLEVVVPSFEVGDDVYFSGYPLATPAMVTHKGMISGFDPKSSIICIQGTINKGNSGGALCDASGRVIGVISMREGGMAVGLRDLNAFIEKTGKNGSAPISGVDPLQAVRAVSQTLDAYISTGIGYARSSTFLKTYLEAHSDFMK